MHDRRRQWAAVIVTWTLIALFAPLARSAGLPQGLRSPPATALSEKAVPTRAAWRSYVLDSPRPFVYPHEVTVLGEAARVSDPEGLSRPGGGVTTISSAGGGEVQLLVDLGSDTGGRVEAAVTSGAGGPLRVSYAESDRYLGADGDTLGRASLGLSDDPDGRSDLILGPRLFVSPGIRGAERYLLIALDGAGQYSIDFIRVAVMSLRPSPADYSGHFLSSSNLLNRIWYAGAYTLNLDTATDPGVPNGRLKLLDGGKRDRLIWLGDLAMESLAGHYTVRQMPAIVARSLRAFGCQQLPGGYIPMASDLAVGCRAGPGKPDGPPSWVRPRFLARRDRLPDNTAWFVVAACDRFELTGAVAETRRLLPVMRRALRYLASWAGADGLFRTPSGAINWRSFDTTEGMSAYTNALWVRALRRLAAIEGAIGSPNRALADRERASKMARALIRRLYDRRAHLFLTNSDSPVLNFPQDANVESLLAGVLRGRRAGLALDGIRRRLWTRYGPLTGESPSDPYVSRYISPYMSGWELIARLQRHQGGAARKLLFALWGHMISSDPRSTLWEAMAPDGSPVSFGNGSIPAGRTSLAHGWSSAPVAALSGYVAGLRPERPGWRRWVVEPQTLGLRFAQGSVGTPFGPLAGRWQSWSSADAFRLTAAAPPGTAGIVAVPLLGTARTIARDGHVVWRRGHPVDGIRAGRTNGYVRFAQGPGTHTYAWSGEG
jgi:alpha-L-rhamnosidase